MARKRLIVAVATLACGVGTAQAQHLQPGMRTMIQQGGVEGTVLGPALPFRYGADPYYGYVYDDPRYGRVVFRDPYAARRSDWGRSTDRYQGHRSRVRVRFNQHYGM